MRWHKTVLSARAWLDGQLPVRVPVTMAVLNQQDWDQVSDIVLPHVKPAIGLIMIREKPEKPASQTLAKTDFARADEIIAIHESNLVTGLGSAGSDGSSLVKLVIQVDGKPVELLESGLDQVNVRLPRSLARIGSVSLQLIVDGIRIQTLRNSDSPPDTSPVSYWAFDLHPSEVVCPRPASSELLHFS